jgi:hypothetical protein
VGGFMADMVGLRVRGRVSGALTESACLQGGGPHLVACSSQFLWGKRAVLGFPIVKEGAQGV